MLRTATWQEPREDEDRLDAKFFERSQVGLDARREGKRETSGGGEKRFSGGRGVCQVGQVVGCIDAQA